MAGSIAFCNSRVVFLCQCESCYILPLINICVQEVLDFHSCSIHYCETPVSAPPASRLCLRHLTPDRGRAGQRGGVVTGAGQKEPRVASGQGKPSPAQSLTAGTGKDFLELAGDNFILGRDFHT